VAFWRELRERQTVALPPLSTYMWGETHTRTGLPYLEFNSLSFGFESIGPLKRDMSKNKEWRTFEVTPYGPRHQRVVYDNFPEWYTCFGTFKSCDMLNKKKKYGAGISHIQARHYKFWNLLSR
jgi:hypothetical protein